MNVLDQISNNKKVFSLFTFLKLHSELWQLFPYLVQISHPSTCLLYLQANLSLLAVLDFGHNPENKIFHENVSKSILHSARICCCVARFERLAISLKITNIQNLLIKSRRRTLKTFFTALKI